jgi:hypothetical protein
MSEYQKRWLAFRSFCDELKKVGIELGDGVYRVQIDAAVDEVVSMTIHRYVMEDSISTIMEEYKIIPKPKK